MDNVAVQGINADGTVRAAMAYVGEKPWWDGVDNKYGVKVEGEAMTAEQAITAGGLDWETEKVATRTIDGYPLEKFAVRRKDNKVILSEGRGAGYTLVQNKSMFSWFDGIVGMGGAIYNTVGALGKGEIVWVLAKLPTDVFVGGKDQVKQYVMLSNGHDGKTPYTLGLTNVRVVCQNTHRMAMNEGFFVRLLHRANIEVRAEEAKATLNIINKHWQETEQVFNQMAQKSINDSLAAELFAQVFAYPGGDSKAAIARRQQTDAVRAQAMVEFHDGVGANLFPNSAWSAYNAVTAISTHDQGRRKDDAHLAYALFGDGARDNDRAYQLFSGVALGA